MPAKHTSVWYDQTHGELRAYAGENTPMWVRERFDLLGVIEEPVPSDIHLLGWTQPRLQLMGYPQRSLTFYNYSYRGTPRERIESCPSAERNSHRGYPRYLLPSGSDHAVQPGYR